MYLELRREIPLLTTQSSMKFTYPTRLADTFSPMGEQVFLPEYTLPPKKIEIKIESGTVGPRLGSWKWETYRFVTGFVGKRETLDHTGKFIFDARFDTDRNPAHIINNIMTPVLYIRNALCEHFQADIDVHVILRSKPSKLAQEAYRLMGIPIILTDEKVKGEIVSISTHRLFSIKPQLFDLDLPVHQDSNLERIFIPRRGNRRLSNNEEVIEFLSNYNFKTIYFEDLSLSEQWSIAQNAKVVVAVHGAAISHLVFNRLRMYEDFHTSSGVKLVEIMPAGWAPDLFRKLISALNGKWCAVQGQISPEVIRSLDFSNEFPDSLKSPFKDPFKVDCQSIQMALNYLEI